MNGLSCSLRQTCHRSILKPCHFHAARLAPVFVTCSGVNAVRVAKLWVRPRCRQIVTSRASRLNRRARRAMCVPLGRICNQGVLWQAPVSEGSMFRGMALILGLALMTGSSFADGTPLQGSIWRMAGEPERSISFSAGGKVSGRGGCNRYFGRYTQVGSKLRISNIGATRMACDKTRMGAESAFFELLRATRNFTIEGKTLSLLGSGKSVLVKLGRR